MVYYHKQENENLLDQLNISESNYQKIENELIKMNKIKNELVINLNTILMKMNNENSVKNAMQDLNLILQILSTKEPGSDNRNIIINEQSQDDININNPKKSNYVTQNYAKFKEKQDFSSRGKQNDTKIMNQSKNKIDKFRFHKQQSQH